SDTKSRDDLRIYLERLQRAVEPEVRMVAKGRVLALFGCTQAPAGILDQTPVVLTLRSFSLTGTADVDVRVQGRALLDRLARQGEEALMLNVPDVTVTVAWAGVLPPRTGWEPSGLVDVESLREVAREGIRRVEEALPEDPGEPVV